MLCCLGLFVGFAIGSTLGGPWMFIALAIGFGLGFMGDTKLMRGNHGGCCGGGHMHSKKVEKGAKDPVCGMEVNEKTTKYKAEFKGRPTTSAPPYAGLCLKKIQRGTLNELVETSII